MKDCELLCRSVGSRLVTAKVTECRVWGYDPSVKTGAAAQVRLNLRTGTTVLSEVVVLRGLGGGSPSALTRNVRRALGHLAGDMHAVGFVEDQLVRATGKGKTKNPQNLIPLAQSAGVAFSALCLSGLGAAYVDPSVWKGSQSKPVNHRHTCKRLSWRDPIAMAGYLRPQAIDYEGVSVKVLNADGSAGKLLGSDWHELMDAIGIALWGAGKIRVAYKTAQYVNKGL